MTSPSPSPDRGTTDRTSTAAELRVEGMHCDACAALIEESLTEQVGVLTASVDLDSARAVVAYDPSLIGLDDLRSTVAEAGYSATAVG